MQACIHLFLICMYLCMFGLDNARNKVAYAVLVCDGNVLVLGTFPLF